MDWEQDLVHLALHAAHLGYGDPRTIFFGEIIDWDPASHVARARIPAFVTVDATTAITSDPAQTPWFPYMTLGIGCQWAPKIGDLCMVIMTERATDAGIILGIAHSDVNMPPLTLNPALAQGEFAFVQRDSKSYVVFRKDGSVLIQATNQGNQQGPSITMDSHGNTIIQAGPQGATYEMFYNGDVVISGAEGGSGESELTLGKDGSASLTSVGGAKVTLDAVGNIILNAPNGDIILQTNQNATSLNQIIFDYNAHGHPYLAGNNPSTTSPPNIKIP